MAAVLTYAEALAVLGRAHKFGINPSLDGITELAEVLGRPQDALRFVQVTGTNGKTSVTRMIAALIHAHGRDAAAYTSPHLESYTERIEIDGAAISEADFARAMSAAIEAAEVAGGGGQTEFELLTAGALWIMRDLGLHWGVLEVGMGGRWDSTSVVEPAVSVVTGVGLDHVERLGATVRDIAADKAHVIKEGSIAVLGPGTIAVADVFEDRAAAVGAEVVHVGDERSGESEVGYRVTAHPSAPGGCTELTVHGRFGSYGDLELRTPSYQAPNVAVAIAAAEAALDTALDPKVTRATLRAMVFPGRFELVSARPPVVLDGAHNPQAAEVLASAISEAWPDAGSRPVAVLGVLADKDAAGIIDALAPVVAGFVVTQPASARALPVEMLAEHVRLQTGEEPLAIEPRLADALAVAMGASGGAVITGSLYTAGEARGPFSRSDVDKRAGGQG
jgi:dihydrofolate synthase / folylpolyglutamate synthase